mmetsp:Transcript_26677/g.78806  ORF Transcript_26677/g.78806 Transcript_26677/m.78806 type:complete len:230 (+) Transcript_26677:961-1650(+)
MRVSRPRLFTSPRGGAVGSLTHRSFDLMRQVRVRQNVELTVPHKLSNLGMLLLRTEIPKLHSPFCHEPDGSPMLPHRWPRHEPRLIHLLREEGDHILHVQAPSVPIRPHPMLRHIEFHQLVSSISRQSMGPSAKSPRRLMLSGEGVVKQLCPPAVEVLWEQGLSIVKKAFDLAPHCLLPRRQVRFRLGRRINWLCDIVRRELLESLPKLSEFRQRLEKAALDLLAQLVK